MLTFDEDRFKKLKEVYELEGEGIQIIKAQATLNLGDSVKDVTVHSSISPSSEEKKSETDDENRTEIEESMEKFEEEEEEVKEFEEEDEDENV